MFGRWIVAGMALGASVAGVAAFWFPTKTYVVAEAAGEVSLEPGLEGAFRDPSVPKRGQLRRGADSTEPTTGASEGERVAALSVLGAAREVLSVAEASATARASAESSDDSATPATLGEPTPADPTLLSPNLFLGALSKETIVFEKPTRDSRKLGFLRTGALVRRGSEPVSRENCSAGWYRIAPEGFVCVGRTATIDEEHPILKLTSVRADRGSALPYVYGRSRYPTPPLYTKIPTAEEQTIAEGDLAGHRVKGFGTIWRDDAGGPPPSILASGARIPRPYGYPVLEHEFMTGRALGNSAFGFIDLFEAEGRRWGLTADLSLVPLDRVVPVEESAFEGVTITEDMPLPLVFVRSSRARLYRGHPERGLEVGPALEYRTAVSITGEEFSRGGVKYLETRDGHWLRDERLVRIDRRDEFPKFVRPGRKWIEVSILQQSLVAYEGETPRFATLVSTGKDGLGDPETTHSTVRGVFLIHTKHVTSTMSGNAADDEFDLRDVPYVQYFHQGFAFHAAFWHDTFGVPRSHGCVNLSPRDARYLFGFTEPPVPQQWHTALSNEGTLVYIHP